MIPDKDCIVCGKHLKELDGVFMLGLDRPYVNLWFHRVCFNLIEPDLLAFLNSKLEEISKEIPIYG